MTTADEKPVQIAMDAESRAPTKFALPQRLVSTAILATLAYGSLAQGGFHARDYQTLLILVGATSGLALLAGLRPRAGAWFVAAGFLSLSTVLSALDARALTDSLPTLALLLAMSAATSIVDRLDDDSATQVSFGLSMIGVLLAATAWIGVAFRYDPWGRVSDGLWRGSSSLTYSNAAASLIGAILLMTAARAIESRTGETSDPDSVRDIGERAPPSTPLTTSFETLVSNLGLFALGCGLLVTQSRAGIAATALGGLVLALRLGIARTITCLFVPGVTAVMASAVALAGSSTEIEGQPERAVGALVLGVLVVTGAAILAPLLSNRPRRRPSVRILAPLLGLALVAGVGLVLSTDNAFGDILERRLTLSSNTASGEVVFFGDRSHEWRAATEAFRGRPLLGVGPGQLELRWAEADGSQYFASFAHNEYLELAATHGLLGVVAALLGATLVFDEIRRRHRSDPSGERWGAYAALITLLAHSGLDYLWHLPLIPLTMSVIVGLMVRESPTRPRLGVD